MSRVVSSCVLLITASLWVVSSLAECRAVDESASPCRYPAGDDLCREQGRPPYAYRDDCAPATNHPAAGACGSMRAIYSEMQYGAALHAVLNNCQREFSQKENLFLAGLAQALLSECGLPRAFEDRLALNNVLQSSALAAVIGTQFGAQDLSRGLQDQAQSQMAYAAGAQLVDAEVVGCGDPLARIWAAALQDHFLERHRRTGAESRFMKTCVREGAKGRSREYCQCLADVLQSVVPEIHKAVYSDGFMEGIIPANPFVGLLALRCNIHNAR